MVKCHYLQLRCYPPLFCDFRQFNIKVSLADHPIIQKEVDELLAKDATEQSTAGGYLCPMLNSSDLITTCTYLLLRCLLSDRYNNLFNRAIILFLLISNMHIYIFLLLSITFTFSILFGNTNFISGGFFHLGWPWLLGFSPHSVNPYCSFAVTRVFVLLFIWHVSGSYLFYMCCKGAQTVMCLLLVHLGLHINLSKSELYLM